MRKYLLLTVCMLCSLRVSAQFSGAGSGTSSDPYQITSAEELFEVRNSLSAYYKLMNDIDLTEWIAEESPTYGWNPIGNSATPFNGVFNGNHKCIKGLWIARSNEDNVGLFGYISDATISNISIVNPTVEGQNFVGVLLGKNNINGNATISNVVVVGGNITGNNYVAGIVGGCIFGTLEKNVPTKTLSVSQCYVGSEIVGSKSVGGIVGACSSAAYRYGDGYTHTYYDYKVQCFDNCFAGNLIAENYAGGIIGQVVDSKYSTNYNFYRNISYGNISATSNTGGICGYSFAGTTMGGGYATVATPVSRISNNISAAGLISSKNTAAYRISNYVGTSYNNYAYINTVLISNNEIVENIADDTSNGIGYGQKTLMKKTTYEGLSFDFNNTWTIIEGESFPYNINQCAPPKITQFSSGKNAVISGTASGNGIVYVFIGDKMFESTVNNGQWSVGLGNIKEGTIARVSVSTGNLMPSISVSAKAVSEGNGGEEPVTPTEHIAYAIWCANNHTLYFTNRSETLATGGTFVPEDGSSSQTITAAWNGTDVTASGNNMPAWWATVYTNLQNVVVERSFSSVQPTSTAYWFFFCSGLTTLDLKNLDTSEVTDMSGMFMNSSALTTISVGNRWSTANVSSSTNMFSGCTNLVGGNGTSYDSGNINHAYAVVDAEGTPGYLTWGGSNMALYDGTSYINDTDTECDEITYTRTFNNTNWQALYIPFEMLYNDWKDDFDVARINDTHQWDDNNDGVIDRTELEVIKVKSGSTEAHTPYLIRAKSKGKKTITVTDATLYAAEEKSYDVSSWNTLYTFTGTYTGVPGETMLGNGYYAFGGGSLHQAADATNALSPFRWYMAVTDRQGNPKNLGEVKVLVFDMEEETDGLSRTESAEKTENAEVYDLSGRRVTNPRQGIYVKNGRKVVIQ